MEFRALNHIKLLEGKDGLAWCCVELAEYNRVLVRSYFSVREAIQIRPTYKTHQITGTYIRLYLLLLLEADKAYQKLKADYFELHHRIKL